MIELTGLGVTFLGGGELNIDDLVNATKLAPKLIAADGAADVAPEQLVPLSATHQRAEVLIQRGVLSEQSKRPISRLNRRTRTLQ